MKNKLAIFDLDGTLFDTSDVNYHAYKRALNEQGYDIDYQYFCDYCNGRHYKEFIVPIVGDDEQILHEIHDLKKKYYANYLDKAKEHTDLFQIASSIREDYYLAIVTTASKKNVMDILNHFGRVDLFELILTQEDVSKKKPDPEGFLKAMEFFGIDGKDTVIFEDSEVGIQAAINAQAKVFKVIQF